MKYLGVLGIVILFSSCQCDVYYSDSKDKDISTPLFNIECSRSNPRYKGDVEVLTVAIEYKKNDSLFVEQRSVDIAPVINGDTLRLTSEYASHYSFEIPKKLNENQKLNLLVSYNIRSGGQIRKERKRFDDLKRIEKCRYKPVLH